MRSSSAVFALASAALLGASSAVAVAAPVKAADGFGVERFYSSAPGAGWFVMDALDMHGGLGGVIALTGDYANQPLRITDGARVVPVVASDASALLGASVTCDRFRLSFTLDRLFVVTGRSATLGAYRYTGPSIDPGTSPDGFADSRVGFEVRLLGHADSSFRLGLGAQLFIPSGARDDYVTDATYRGMGRILFAGDHGPFTYAGHLGVHIRPVSDDGAPGNPRGSELLYGVAAGVKLPLFTPGDGADGAEALIVGPELYGETALTALFARETTGLEGLLSARLEPLSPRHDHAQLRFKLGAGAGLDAGFGTPRWRVVAGIEIFDLGR